MSTASARSLLARAPVAAYAVLAYLLTWACAAPLTAARRGWSDWHPGDGLEAVSAFGPLVAALTVSAAVAGRRGVVDLLRGIGRWRIGVRWLWFAGGSPLVLLALAAGIVRLTSGTWPALDALQAGRLATAGGVVHLVVISGLLQALGEEPGWRGFMLPRLRQRRTVIGATFVLFPVWLFWHLPAFLGRPDFGVAQALAFAVGVLSAAVWLTLIWEHTESSLAAIAWHAMINIARGIAVAISTPMFLAMSTLVLAGAGAIAAWWLIRGAGARRRGSPAD